MAPPPALSLTPFKTRRNGDGSIKMRVTGHIRGSDHNAGKLLKI